MQIKYIDQLPEINGLTNDIEFPIRKESETLKTSLGEIKEFILEGVSSESVESIVENLIEGHNEDTEAHEDIRESVTAAVEGVQIIPLSGSLLTRVINGTTPIAKILFDTDTVFTSGKTLINDDDGTIGVYIGDIDSATISIETKSISPLASNEPTLLGNVDYFTDLPLTVDEAEALGWNTPRIDDYARVLEDENNNDKTVEWYIVDVDSSGDITWGNPVVINTSDYQAQTTAQDAGRVLTGGAAAGTFGASLGVDTVPTSGSNNLITSGAAANAITELSGIIAELENREKYVVPDLTKLQTLISYGVGLYQNTTVAQTPSIATIPEDGFIFASIFLNNTSYTRTLLINGVLVANRAYESFYCGIIPVKKDDIVTLTDNYTPTVSRQRTLLFWPNKL